MNGDTNGTMAESMEVALPISSSSDKEADESKVTLTDCDDKKNENVLNGNNADTENGDTSDNESINSTADNKSKETTVGNSLNPDDKPMEKTETNSGNDPHNSNDIASINHVSEKCNGSNPDSPSSLKNLETENKNEESENKNEESENKTSAIKNEALTEEDQELLNEDNVDYDSMAEGSAISGDVKAEDTVSIDLDSESDNNEDESSRDSQSKSRISDIIVLDGENRVHEIDTDKEDCVIESAKKTSNEAEEKGQLRRSSRAVKRKRYTDEVALENGDDESDVEEVTPVDPLRHKSMPIVISDSRSLATIPAKHMKADHGKNRKKDPTLVIIGGNSTSTKVNTMQQSKSLPSSNSTSLQNLYQNIVARGTTVTPISTKNNSNSLQTSQNATQNILPSLTDDMFVVEAPSFIVPYVYEKPSITAFREFVDKLGKQLEEEKIKEKERREKEKQEKRERGETVESDDDDNAEKSFESVEEATSNKRKTKRERRRRNMEDDDSWDGESLSESDDDALTDEDDKIVVKDKVELDQINVVTDLTADKICSNKSNEKSSMDCSLGKFFINIGLNLVQEYVQSDLLKQQNRKLYREKKAGHSTKATESSIGQLKKNLEFSKENNAPYNFPQEKCEFCSFKTDSKLVMAHHLETPHMKNNNYKCNYCSFEIRSPHDILYHMEAVHNVRGKLERAPSYHQCANCPFEDNGKGKLARHLIACAKKFKPETNLAPPIDWEPPAKIPKIAKPRNNVMSPYQNAFNRSLMTPIRGSMNIGGAAAPNAGFRARGKTPMGPLPRPPLPVQGVPILRGPSMVRPASANMTNNFNNSKPKSHQPSISITPLPRQSAPSQHLQPTNVANHKNSFVICEICDGYIKDLEQLRNHMQWIHKVKIHPKMIYNRPPLNCQKCQFRFFTDQGFERHLLGSHGLVTSSMQEAANKGKDAGRCPVCGRVYQWKLLNHVARDHNITLKPGHLSYKCTVCTATFGMYKQFENHVYSAHSVVAKKVMDKNKGASQPAKASSETLQKPLKINEEITIIPQSVKSMATKSAKDK